MASYISTHTGAQLDKGVSVAAGSIAPDFDSTKTYSVDVMVIYQGNLYKCKTAVETAGPWDPTHWNQIKLSDVIKDADLEWGTF